MMHHMSPFRATLVIAALAAAALVCCPSTAGAADAGTLDEKRFQQLHALIKPHDEEARWATVDWMAATDIWAARKKAAEADRPVFIWYMAGEPLGTC